MKLSGKTILITGGTSGIGWELAQQLLKKNNRVIILGRDQGKLTAAKKLGFSTIHCDLVDVEQIEAAVLSIQNDFADLDVLFNNAGVQYNYDFTNAVVALDKIHQEIMINVTGQLILTQLLIPVLSTSEHALVVNTTSALGMFPKPDGLIYSASKAAMRNFTTGLRYALKNTNIKVIEFIPPVTATAMTAQRAEEKMPADQLIELAIPQIEKGKAMVTVGKIRVFRWLAFLFPAIANRILAGNK
ncbi:MAG: SDR family NAD(P)-dependent oxidoreductase [Saprospiraceae bacterium]|nr:SDR family NAD(P)-dependent oxidoreductase [Saprospiraceae bacterium]